MHPMYAKSNYVCWKIAQAVKIYKAALMNAAETILISQRCWDVVYSMSEERHF